MNDESKRALAKAAAVLMADGALRARRHAAAGYYGTCVDCPVHDGMVLPELCKYADRYDHQLRRSDDLPARGAPARGPAVMHLITQRDQPYGSVRRCCEVCGRVPRATESATDDPVEFGALPDGFVTCSRAKAAHTPEASDG